MDHHLLTAHMAQHLLLMTVAAPLILLEAPTVTLLHGIPQRFVLSVLNPLLGFPPLQAVGSLLTYPVFCWLASITTVIAWHVPALFAIGMQSEWWHAPAHLSFFASGLLLWSP